MNVEQGTRSLQGIQDGPRSVRVKHMLEAELRWRTEGPPAPVRLTNAQMALILRMDGGIEEDGVFTEDSSRQAGMMPFINVPLLRVANQWMAMLPSWLRIPWMTTHQEEDNIAKKLLRLWYNPKITRP